MIGFLISIVVLAVSLLIISKLPLGVEIDNPWIALIAGGIIGAFNAIWSVFPGWIKVPVGVLSLGLIPLIGSIIIFGLAAWIVQGFRLRWGIASAILGAIALSIVNWVMVSILNQFPWFAAQ
ncbi:MAG: phage holin family protein [Cyanobacteria bacterium CRU_2_1]|nr:phage holin family protein [Cyanobacteria bacterium CRU_2_1]